MAATLSTFPFAFLILFFAQKIECQVFQGGSCPDVTPVQNFNAAEYLGTWYEYENYFTPYQILQKCVKAVYTDLGNDEIGVANFGVIAGYEISVTGKAVPVDASSTEAKYTVSFGSFNFFNFGSNSDGNYWVLDTDYNSYAIVWSCQENNFFIPFHTETLWVLTRDRDPSDFVTQGARKKITELGLRTSPLHETDQDDCSN